MVISCYVFAGQQLPELSLNHEVADTLWLPLSYLRDSGNRESMQWRSSRGKLSLTLPCYFYEGKRVWGLSLMMLDELLTIAE